MRAGQVVLLCGMPVDKSPSTSQTTEYPTAAPEQAL
jgi:hypothetical protein